jgi:hypothetical protein
MPRHVPEPGPGLSPGSQADGGLLVTRHGWRPQDWLERAALDRMEAAGPRRSAPGGQPGTPADPLPLYAGFPWSAYLDSLEQPAGTLEASYLRLALRTLGTLAPRKAGLVTVCQHPRLPDHLHHLAAAGVTDVFWPGAPSGEGRLHPSGVTLHPFAALPAPGSPPVTGEGPGDAFAFCTAEAGGNTPRLWGALAAGLIPVLPALPHPALPGPAALWRAAAVLLEPGQDAAALLAGIADTPGRPEAMRRAGAGVQLLYGQAGLIHDVLLCLMARSGQTARPQPLPDPEAEPGLLHGLILRLKDRDSLSPAEAVLVLQQAVSDLLCDHRSDLRLAPGPQSAAAWRLVALARSSLSAGAAGGVAPEIARFDAILDHLRARNRLSLQEGPGARRPAAMRVFLLGPRGQRTPLSYGPMRPHLGDRIALVDRAEDADLVVTGWNRDLQENRAMLAGLAMRPSGGPRLVVLSEEPLWDSLWSGGPIPRDRMLDCGAVQLPYRFLNHVTSDIFAFRHLPWFVLSADSFAARHAMLIAGFAALTPRALLQHWLAAPWQAAFVAERRQTEDWAAAFPAEGMAGLSLYRSRVAGLTPGPHVLRVGQGWPGTEAPRQDLPDWHLDKLALLHGRVRICAAHENTLQRDYITEKPFDAFAVGAIPAVIADPGHRLFDLILPEAMLNMPLAPPELAAARIATFVPDLAMAEAWRDTAQALLARFRDTALILDERQRIADACIAELHQALRDRAAATASA